MEKEKRPQTQNRPGIQKKMKPQPDTLPTKQSGKMKNKILFITGADSGIGKACAILFAQEGADVAIVYLNEHEDAKDTKKKIEDLGRKCLLIPGNITKEKFCNDAISKAIKEFGRIDILVNNAATQFESDTLENISTKNMITTFETNIFSMFWITKAALPYMKKGSAIINTTSVTAYRGSPQLIDYAATKGAIVAFTRSLSDNLIERKIRVNAVAPGPIWTPLIPATFDAKKTAEHGSKAPMKRAGEPSEVAPSYLFLASNEDSGYMSGQVLHPNGGEVVNG
jgi:NAD(P)-dependent dehydrogenase (short-subunit alcohol dehydrogenase family)